MRNIGIENCMPGRRLPGNILKILACFCILIACTATLRAGDRLNILYIFTDDQSTRSVSAYPESHSWVHTPNIDRLANSGMRFSNCYTGA